MARTNRTSLPTTEAEPQAATGSIVLRPMSVQELANELGKPATELIVELLRSGMACNKNYVLPERVVAQLAQERGIEVVAPTGAADEKGLLELRKAAEGDALQERYPVVVVMGHVDHGKTTLLDFIRKTRVASKEKGGITQHVGAYEVATNNGTIVFLDTPGHEAFSKMRARGAGVADIAVLVVAADDSVMPQTIEAIKHAKAMNVPIVVAINKIDKASAAQIEAVKRDLAQHDLLPEEWGGEVVCVSISALTGTGVSELLDLLALQAQVLELKADPTVPARGYVLEARLERGRGPVATVICMQGTLAIGDYFVCGRAHGRVNGLVNSAGKRVQRVVPSIPVQVSGFNELPSVGEIFEVVPVAHYRKARAGKLGPRISGPQPYRGDKEAINVILKAEGQSSLEALQGALQKISEKSEKKLSFVHTGVGPISENDVSFAASSNSLIFGFHVKPEASALQAARQLGVSIARFDIIYRLLEHVEEMLARYRTIKMIREQIGVAEVRKVFRTKKYGVIAGCQVKDGIIVRNGVIEVWRDGYKVGEGAIKSLQREKKTMKEVKAGFECAFVIEDFDDWQEGDEARCFIERPEEKK